MLDLKDMEDCLDQKIKIIKSILKLQLLALEMYDESPDNLEILCKHEEIEHFKQQIVDVDLAFLFYYQKILSANGVKALQDLAKEEQKQFEKIQGIVGHIKILEEHQAIQTKALESIFSNLKILQNKQLKTQKVVGAYQRTKK